MSEPYHLFLCTGTTCSQQGAEESLQQLRERLFEKNLKQVRLTLCRCLGQCGNGPNMVIYPEGTWYGKMTEETIDQLVSQHLISGKVLADRVLIPVD